jgi:hypothetical protein
VLDGNILANLHVVSVAMAVCTHSTATVASNETKDDQRRRNRFIGNSHRNRIGGTEA